MGEIVQFGSATVLGTVEYDSHTAKHGKYLVCPKTEQICVTTLSRPDTRLRMEGLCI
jgi:hypothetical protein